MGFRSNVQIAGPGRFEGCGVDARLAEAVYGASLDGCDEEAGSVDAAGWAGLVISRRRAYIVGQDTYGFVTVDAFDTHEAARAEWDNVASELAEAEEMFDKEEAV